ncbi:lytic transglycosylase domain-containing protein [Alsobacter sp. SYSU BS001988]
MFLFTTPTATPETRAQSPVVDAIKQGSEQTGTDFGYLLQTAQRESSLDPAAKAKSSSASGLFQFIEQTWLGLIKSKGAEHGLGSQAQAITQSQQGRYDVPDPAARQQILQLRNDPQTAAVMAGELTRQNTAALTSALGRAPSSGELYAAHFLGAAGAGELVKRAQSTPQASAADVFPDQAAANRAVFTDRATGRPKTVGELYASLARAGAPQAIPADPAAWGAAGEQPHAPALAYARQDGPPMHGLFRTEGSRAPMNQTVARLWAGLPAARAADDAPRFYPRTASLGASPKASDAAPAGAANLVVTPAAPAQAAAVPLPPERPAEFGPSVRTAAMAGVEPAKAGPRRGRAPLDLLSFMKKAAP